MIRELNNTLNNLKEFFSLSLHILREVPPPGRSIMRDYARISLAFSISSMEPISTQDANPARGYH